MSKPCLGKERCVKKKPESLNKKKTYFSEGGETHPVLIQFLQV